MSLRVLIVDDHEVFREGLKSLLVAQGFDVVGEASRGRAALRLARALTPDLAILDIAMPELNGLEAARIMGRDVPKTRCIILTMHGEDAYVLEALRAGVLGFVLKSQAFSDLTQAIQAVTAGSVYLSPGISRAVVDASLGGGVARPDPLTTREREVLHLVAEGRTTKAIADVLGISAKTVETHRGAIMRKLDIHDTPSLVRYAIRRGLIEA
jgi:two-component system, NarL family, response regulator NreC